jgi:hypothetical protein
MAPIPSSDFVQDKPRYDLSLLISFRITFVRHAQESVRTVALSSSVSALSPKRAARG